MPTPEPLQDFAWRSESDAPRPQALVDIDDRTTADEALKRVRRGEVLRYVGDFLNAKQLLQAMERRLPPPAAAHSPLEAFRAERLQRQREQETLSKVVVSLAPGYRLALPRAPEVAKACSDVWGPSPAQATVVALKTLLGMLGAAQWRKTGLAVPGLKGKLTPHYGVYLPTRHEYVELLLRRPEVVQGKSAIEVGTGTGVLSFVLLQRGASAVRATDVEPRAVACARENATHLGLSARFTVEEADLFPDARADLVLFNPPWLPEQPKSRVDRAVFDAGGQALEGFLAGLSAHLNPGGLGLLILSDLAQRLGLRPPEFLGQRLAAHGLAVAWSESAPARHGKAKDAAQPLHAARSAEVTTLYALQPVP